MEKSVLLIDDEYRLREVTRLTLTLRTSWRILTASSGPEGYQIATQTPLDAILLDVMMPQQDGLTTLHQLASHPQTQSIPVILLSAKANLLKSTSVTTPNMSGIITKPFDPLTLADQIARILGWSTTSADL